MPIPPIGRIDAALRVLSKRKHRAGEPTQTGLNADPASAGVTDTLDSLLAQLPAAEWRSRELRKRVVRAILADQLPSGAEPQIDADAIEAELSKPDYDEMWQAVFARHTDERA